MAVKTSKKTTARKPRRTPSPKRRWVRRCLICLFLLLFLCAGWMVGEARIVRLQYTELPLADLPEGLDGTRILFVSDLHMDGWTTPRQTNRLFNQLASLQPDILMLGGDYAQQGIWSRFAERIGLLNEGSTAQKQQQQNQAFFAGLSEFPARMKIAVAGEADQNATGLEDFARQGGVTLLRNQVVQYNVEGSVLYVVGLRDWMSDKEAVGKVEADFNGDECVIVLSHNPDALPALNNQLTEQGRPWIDAMFSGHTHGGQLNLFGRRPLLVNSEYGDRFLSGWYLEDTTKLLVSNGLGSGQIPFRLWTAPQAHLIVLRTGQPRANSNE